LLVDPTTQTMHRPWPLPSTPWRMHQTWHDLLFAHWPLRADVLRPLVPANLEIDTFDGSAWLSIVPFRMSGVRPRRTPAVPGLSAFPELNVRTYVTVRAPNALQPGVFFFSLDAGNAVAVAIARRFFMLPYFRASMSLVDTLQSIRYASERTHRGAAPARFVAEYAPVGGIKPAQAGTLDHWLAERYCLYTVNRRGTLYQSEIHHLPWPLQTAECEIHINTLAQAAGLQLPDVSPLLQFARRLDVLIWPLRRLRP
jgi:uncharacterized protein